MSQEKNVPTSLFSEFVETYASLKKLYDNSNNVDINEMQQLIEFFDFTKMWSLLAAIKKRNPEGASELEITEFNFKVLIAMLNNALNNAVIHNQRYDTHKYCNIDLDVESDVDENHLKSLLKPPLINNSINNKPYEFFNDLKAYAVKNRLNNFFPNQENTLQSARLNNKFGFSG